MKMFNSRCLIKQLQNAVFLALNISRVNKRTVSTSSVLLRGFRSPFKYSRFKISSVEENEETISLEDQNTFQNENLDELLDRTVIRCGSGHQVFVIQPFIKWGRGKKRNTTPELQLLESVTLIKTLREWKVVGETIISLKSFAKKTFFGKGNLEMISNMVSDCRKISAIFISVNTLTLIQQKILQEHFGVPVFDRYTIIMHIFREHATSKEAILQIKLAELPYLWTVMRGINWGTGGTLGGTLDTVGGHQIRSLSYRREMFKSRMAKIRKAILELREQREMLRKERKKKEIPVVAVIGYTNSGKTSIIKALTGKESLQPQDYLFATLDVTAHLGELPSSLKVNYMDTLGFISDIPTYLIESFVSTLEDAISADVIIHVRDISHPDTVAQNDNVIKILRDLNLSEDSLERMIVVGNKVDKLDPETLDLFRGGNMILVSSTNLTGIDILRDEIEKRVLGVIDMIPMTIRVASGREEYDWLHSNVTVLNEVADPKDHQYVFVKTLISQTALAKFKHRFIKEYKTGKR